MGLYNSGLYSGVVLI